MSPYYITYDHVVEVLQIHPAECVFELDAPLKIFTRLMAAGFYTDADITWGRNEEFVECWHLSEIYCPHEGIDRRSEYGMVDMMSD
jgi:hypothetical protein